MGTKHVCKFPIFVPQYIHYRTKKLMRAVDYGYSAWCFCGCRRKAGRK